MLYLFVQYSNLVRLPYLSFRWVQQSQFILFYAFQKERNALIENELSRQTSKSRYDFRDQTRTLKYMSKKLYIYADNLWCS